LISRLFCPISQNSKEKEREKKEKRQKKNQGGIFTCGRRRVRELKLQKSLKERERRRERKKHEEKKREPCPASDFLCFPDPVA
jgi:hypothetical protein